MYPHQNTPSGYPSVDDFASRHQHPLTGDGYAPKIMSAQHQQDQREHSTTCVPSLIPPGIDPSQVDVRTFFPYQPNEVKHRKRTTRPQLKVLEDVYKYDTKPAAALRKKLADELGMVPRGVQVWFQNRRAKEKNLARKAELAGEGGAAALKKPLDLSTSAASSSSSPDPPASSSPTPVPVNPSNSSETSPSLGPQDATATPPESSSSRSSSSPMSSTSLPRIDASDASDDGLSFPPESDNGAASYLLGTPTRPTAEALSQRRTSLPILSLTPSGPAGSARGLAPRASIHGGGGSGMLSVSHGQSPPHGFDPMLRRRSVDTNIKRLSAHPYAHLARGTNDRFHGANPAHIHSLPSADRLSVDGPGRLDGIPGTLGGGGRTGLGLRHGSMPHVFQSPPRAPPPVPDFAGLHPARPTLTQKHSLPAFHEQQQPLREFDFRHHTPLFTNPDPFATAAGSGPAPVFEYDAVSPLAGGMHHAPASPSEASPPPIAQSLVSSYGMHVPARPMPPPVPGPLPDASFSFGEPAASSPSLASSASSSPPSDHSTVVGVRRGSGDSVPEGDDTSAGSSSAYDPLSRFGSFASVDSRSSWTSYYSEGPPQDAKEGGAQLDVPDGFDPARRGSFASYHLPELLGGLDVTDHGSSPPEHAELSGEQSAYSPHMHQVYQDKQDGFAAQGAYLTPDAGAFVPHGHHLVYPTTAQDPYAPPGVDMYAAALDKGGAVLMGHCEPPVLPHHARSSSELAYALQAPASGNMGLNQHAFAMGYADGHAHPPAAPDPSVGYDTSYEPHHAGAYDAQLGTHMDYNIYAGTPMYASGAVELDSMCVPATMTMDGISLGDYATHYA